MAAGHAHATSHKRLTTAGLACPRCGSKVCDLPTECPTCSLPLISSPHLARTYHHLFPLDAFVEQPAVTGDRYVHASPRVQAMLATPPGMLTPRHPGGEGGVVAQATVCGLPAAVPSG